MSLCESAPDLDAYRYLEVRCLGCDMNQTVALDVVRRPKTTPIHELERYMRCKDCSRGFAVDQATLPKGATQTHVSLFDGSNCGIQLESKPVFSVQYHPEASPGPRDSHYLFKRFADLMRAKKSA